MGLRGIKRGRRRRKGLIRVRVRLDVIAALGEKGDKHILYRNPKVSSSGDFC